MKMGRLLKGFFMLPLKFVKAVTGGGWVTKNKLSVSACLSYMKNKYGIDFSIFEGEKIHNLTWTILEIYVECADYAGKKILVMEERLNNGEKLVFRDNFLAVKYHEKTKAMAEKLASEVYGECKVLCEVMNNNVQPDEFDKTTTFEEFCSTRGSNIWFEVLLPTYHSDAKKEEELKQLEQKCADSRFACICDVYYAVDEKAYESISTHAELMQHGSKLYKVAGKFMSRNSCSDFFETWR